MIGIVKCDRSEVMLSISLLKWFPHDEIHKWFRKNASIFIFNSNNKPHVKTIQQNLILSLSFSHPFVCALIFFESFQFNKDVINSRPYQILTPNILSFKFSLNVCFILGVWSVFVCQTDHYSFIFLKLIVWLNESSSRMPH